MALRYLLDENLRPAYKAQIVRRERELVVRAVGEVDAPPKGASDPEGQVLVPLADADHQRDLPAAGRPRWLGAVWREDQQQREQQQADRPPASV